MKNPVYDTPESAELAFYKAFEDTDLEGMMNVWARRSEIECIHPFGERLKGAAAVRESWQQLFRNDQQLHFRLDQISTVTDAQLAVHVLHENITVADRTLHRVIATNVYQRSASGWHMILHHASTTAIQNDKAADGAEHQPALH